MRARNIVLLSQTASFDHRVERVAQGLRGGRCRSSVLRVRVFFTQEGDLTVGENAHFLLVHLLHAECSDERGDDLADGPVEEPLHAAEGNYQAACVDVRAAELGPALLVEVRVVHLDSVCRLTRLPADVRLGFCDLREREFPFAWVAPLVGPEDKFVEVRICWRLVLRLVRDRGVDDDQITRLSVATFREELVNRRSRETHCLVADVGREPSEAGIHSQTSLIVSSSLEVVSTMERRIYFSTKV